MSLTSTVPAGLDAITPSDERYDAARTLWNALVDHRPAAILRPRSPAQVAQAVLRARGTGLPLAVRGGGHSVAGQSMADGGITIDLSNLRHVHVDPQARTARVGGGALLDDVMTAAEPHDLTMPFGHVSHTGVGGLTLGGGIGWVMRRDGLAVDRLRCAEVVTADGRVVRASADEHPDLFWALRGGGGNFGVVTELEFELRPFGPLVLAGMVLYPLDQAVDALRHSRDFMEQAPRELTVFETFMTVPPGPPFPEHLRGRPALAIAMMYAGDPDEGERVTAPLRAFGPPALELVGPMPPTAAGRLLDPTAPHGMRNYNKSHWLAGLPDSAVETLVECHAAVTAPMSAIITARMGGAVDDVAVGDTAFGHRGMNRLLWIISAWWQGDAAEHVEWCRGVFDAMAPHATGGVYVNALDGDEDGRIPAAYDARVWRRLTEVKAAWDPDNVFRLNPNVPPA